MLENGVQVQQNYYDASGRRVEQTTGGATTLYLYAGLNILYEKNLKTGISTKHIYADGIQIAMITSGIFFLHQDELGITRLVTNNGGATVFSSDYVPYGVQYGSSGAEDFMYTGQLYDSTTGLYYFNARFYDPSTGRFLTLDPTPGIQVDPQSLNGYAYARDNPLTFIDPTGMVWWNPLTWTPTQAILAGAVIGLTIISAAQAGLDPITDALDVGAISELAGSFTMSAVAVGASAIGLPIISLGTEDSEPGMDEWLASLTPEEFDAFVMNEPKVTYRTDIVQSRLASMLGGTAEEQRIYTTVGPEGRQRPFRVYDVTSDDVFGELKFGRDALVSHQLDKDAEIMQSGGNVQYYLIDDPVKGYGPSRATMNTLQARGIPYTHLTWGDFLGWI